MGYASIVRQPPQIKWDTVLFRRKGRRGEGKRKEWNEEKKKKKRSAKRIKAQHTQRKER